MVIYVYKCDSCGEQYEEKQKMTDKPKTKCKFCGARKLKKVLFPFTMLFNGEGFHINDYDSIGRKGERNIN